MVEDFLGFGTCVTLTFSLQPYGLRCVCQLVKYARGNNACFSIADRSCCDFTFDHAQAFSGNASCISQSSLGIGYDRPRCRESSVLLSTVLPALRLPTLLLWTALLPLLLSLLGLWLAVQRVACPQAELGTNTVAYSSFSASSRNSSGTDRDSPNTTDPYPTASHPKRSRIMSTARSAVQRAIPRFVPGLRLSSSSPSGSSS